MFLAREYDIQVEMSLMLQETSAHDDSYAWRYTLEVQFHKYNITGNV